MHHILSSCIRKEDQSVHNPLEVFVLHHNRIGVELELEVEVAFILGKKYYGIFFPIVVIFIILFHSVFRL